MSTDKQKRNREKNLKPWPKGTSGNPAGRPPAAMSISTTLRELGAANDGERVRALAEVVWKAALSGEPWATAFLVERTEGKVRDAILLEQAAPPEIRFVVQSENQRNLVEALTDRLTKGEI